MRRTLTSVARKAGAVLPTGQRVAQRAVHKSTAQALSARGMARAMAGTRSFFSYSHALVRGLSPAFEDSLKLHAPETPIDMNLAHQQHDSYTQLLRLLVPNVIELPADARYPDCCFVEDTTVIVGDTAVITKIGADARQGEEVATRSALADLGFQKLVNLEAPGTLDGGDVLYVGDDIFVGLSKRTNASAIDQLGNIFSPKGINVHAIEVTGSLHLKSVMSALDESTILCADTEAGHNVAQQMKSKVGPRKYEYLFVPDVPASNVLRIGSNVVIQNGFPKSEAIIRDACRERGLTISKLHMSEFIKADGALTCCSVLFSMEN